MELSKKIYLESKCSKYFNFSDFFECSDTYKRVLCDNTPKELGTFKAVEYLAKEILDKVQDEFGHVNLTYGFCSFELDKHIVKNNYPKLDQHAGHELNKKGNFICDRLGFAADFIVPNVSSLAVSRYIVTHLKFDRLYYYGKDRPVHVSLNEQPIYSVVLMRRHGSRRVPSQITNEKFILSGIDF